MQLIRIPVNSAFLFSMLVALCSCIEQNQKPIQDNVEHAVLFSIGDTVSGLGNGIGCILQDKGGNYWFASNGDGAYRYDGKTLTNITRKHGLCSDFVLEIQEDVYGNIWFSTRDGICCYNKITFIDYTKKIQNTPVGKLQYTKGGLFFDHLNGICFFDGTSFTNFVIHPDNYIAATNDMRGPYRIYSTLVDKDGNIWFGTQSEGVCRYDNNTFSYLTDKNLAGPAVRTLFQDTRGNLWFGNNGGGLFRYDGKTLTNMTEERGLGNPEFLKGHYNDKPGSLARVWAINEDREGNLWIGTIDAGLWKFDGTSLTNYTTKEGLSGNSIWAIYKDHAGELWFVADGRSVNKFNGSTFTKQEFN